MKKQLKDYIGYYIDQLVTTSQENYQTTHPLTLFGFDLGSDLTTYVCHVLDAGINLPYYINLSEVKLVLRPLSSLSKEEEQEIRDACFTLPAIRTHELIEQTAEYIDVLRGRGYDVYGLIAAGLAVPNAYKPAKTPCDEKNP